MLGSLIKIIIFFFIIYFIINIIRSAFGFSRKMRTEREKFSRKRNKSGPDDRVIELDKDQYKVE